MNQGMPWVMETQAKLLEMIADEQDPLLLKRLRMLFLFATRQAKNRSEAAAALGINRETVGDWLRLYTTQGLEGLLTRKNAPGAESSLPPEVIEGLRQKLVDPTGIRSYQELRHWVEATYELQTTDRIIWYTATKVLGSGLPSARGRREGKSR
jgi:transposase